MNIAWAEVATIFLAIVLASLVERTLLNGEAKAPQTESNPAPKTTGNPITDYLRSKYPHAEGVS